MILAMQTDLNVIIISVVQCWMDFKLKMQIIDSKFDLNTVYLLSNILFLRKKLIALAQFSSQPLKHLQRPLCCQTPSHGAPGESPENTTRS